jgi:hypothetical protein
MPRGKVNAEPTAEKQSTGSRAESQDKQRGHPAIRNCNSHPTGQQRGPIELRPAVGLVAKDNQHRDPMPFLTLLFGRGVIKKKWCGSSKTALRSRRGTQGAWEPSRVSPDPGIPSALL